MEALKSRRKKLAETTEGSTTEIVVHGPATQRLFMTSAIQDRLDTADFSNPAAIKIIRSIDMSSYEGITSVAVKNEVIGVARPNADEQKNGSVVFLTTDEAFLMPSKNTLRRTNISP
jgi:hypothetical protein